MPKSSTVVSPGPDLSAPPALGIRWFVCLLLFFATTINYLDRSVLSLIEPLLHLPFMGWIPGIAAPYQFAYHLHYGHIVECFQIAYGIGLLTASPLIDRFGTKAGYALAIVVWAFASLGHSFVGSVLGFCIARTMLGLGESCNFPAAIKATTEWFPTEERALATGLFNSGSNAAFFIAPAIIPIVTMRFGWRAAFLCTGSLGFLWLIAWMSFPYYRLRRDMTATQENLQTVVPHVTGFALWGPLLRTRGLYAFALAKGLTDPVWWFYLFYLPMFLNDNYGLDLRHAYWPLVSVYAVSSVGSIAGGSLSGVLMRRGFSVNSGRKITLLIMAICVLPIMLVPHMHVLFPNNAWPAIALFSLAAAAHQGWSANIFSTPTDMFPSSAVSTVVGMGGAVGSAGGAAFTWLVSRYFSLHPLVIFLMASCAYLTALAIFHVLVPKLGVVADNHFQEA